MKRAVLFLAALMALAGTLSAQTSNDVNEGSQLNFDNSTGAFTFSWWGCYGRTYFIQHSDDLHQWIYVPLIESGSGYPVQWGFTSTADKFFVRLKYTDQATEDPWNDDFDGDGISNINEVQQGSDPLDYYIQPSSAITPNVTILSGNNQSSGSDRFAAQPAVLLVSNSSVPLQNAPVTLTAGTNILISTGSNTATLSNKLDVRTGSSGQISVFLWFSGEPGDRTVTYQTQGHSSTTGTISAQVIPAVPVVPTGVKVSRTKNDDILLTWTDTSTNETGYIIYQSDDGGSTWRPVAFTGPNTTSYILSQAGVAASSLFRVTASNGTGASDPSSQVETPDPLPAVQYAVIDIAQIYSTNAVAINNQGTVAFMNFNPSENTSKLYRLKSGTPEQLFAPSALGLCFYTSLTNSGVDIDDSGNIVATVYETEPGSDSMLIAIGNYKGALWTPDEKTGTVLGSPTFTFHTVGPAPDYKTETHTTHYSGKQLTIDGGNIYGTATTKLAEDYNYIEEIDKIVSYGQNWVDDGVMWSANNTGGISAILGSANVTFSNDEGYKYSGARKCVLQSKGGHTISETYDYVSGATQYFLDDTPAVDSFFPSAINRAGEAIGSHWLYQNGQLVDLNDKLGSKFYAQALNSRQIKVDQRTISSPQILGIGIDSDGGNQPIIIEKKLGKDEWKSSLLADLVNSDSGWTFAWIGTQAINDSGLIATYARKNSDNTRHAVLLLPVELAVDANRDGFIKFSGNASDSSVADKQFDKTTEDKPYRFWVNDDDDHGNAPGSGGEEHVPIVRADYTSSVISSKRDLEDFARLWVYIGGFHEAISSGSVQIGFKWKTVSSGSPAIKIFLAADTSGSDGYLKDDTAAAAQVSGTYSSVIKDKDNNEQIATSGTFVLPKSVWNGFSSSNSTQHFLFEGCTEGKGQLEIVLLDGTGNQIGEGGSLWLDIKNIKKMYERAKATPESIDAPYNYTGPNNTPPEPSMSWTQDLNGNSSDYSSTSWTETQQYVVFVHGWNQDYNQSTNFAESMFKRLWQRGYKGRFASFRWPTYVGDTTFNDSEYIAWKCGESLKGYVDNLPSDYTKNLVAHSMGNIVSGSALQKGMSISNYVLLNAAVPATCYDENIAQDWSYTTPDSDDDAGTRALGYKGQLKSVAGNLVNFYLPDDSALTVWWVGNNYAFKPQRFNAGATGYFYHPQDAAGEKLGITYMTVVGRFVTTAHEAMAYVDQSNTKQTGAISTGGPIGSNNVNMNDNYNFGSEHSAEFNFTLHKTASLYNRVLFTFGVSYLP